MSTKELGDKGENLACEYLVKKGYKILGRNYRINFGEIDIIAKKRWRLFGKDNKTIHFVEVKTLAENSSFYPEEHVNYEKQNKLKRLAEIWLEKNKFPQNYPYQIDIVAVSGNPSAGSAQVDFFENAVSGK